MPSSSGKFVYVFIPANDSLPIETKLGDKSGGLSDDFLSKEAKRYFFESSDKGARAAALDNATPEQKKILANQLREEANAAAAQSQYSAQIAALDDDALVNIMRTTHTSATCEITALTVPTPLNNQRAVSMYTADDARTQNLPINRRATEILVACGHSVNNDQGSGGICGDAFVGRCHDNEIMDVWERVDFSVEDADPKAQWCEVARKPGGGGGGGSAGARSLSGLMGENAANALMGSGGAGVSSFSEGNGDGYTWSQNDEEVEMRFPVASGTKAKYVKVNFGKSSLKVVVYGQTLLSGELGGSVQIDDSTYTIEDANSGSGKELCVTLGKSEAFTWPFVVR